MRGLVTEVLYSVRLIRIFFWTLVSVCVLASGGAHAQKKIVYIGSSEIGALEPRRLRIVAELNRLGHATDTEFTVTSRSYNNDKQQLSALVQAIVSEKPDLIYAAAWDAANALKPLTKTIPIVFAARANLESPAFRIVENLQRPEANLTGYTRYINLVPKKLQVLRDAFPSTRRVGLLYGVDMRDERRIEYESAAGKLGLTISWRKFRKDEIVGLAAHLNDAPDDAYIVLVDDLVIYNRAVFVPEMAKVRRPLIFPEDATDKGVLMHYVPVMDGETKAAEYISKLLRGAKIRDLAVQEPQEFDFSVNVTTLRRNGLTMSRDVLARARKVE